MGQRLGAGSAEILKVAANSIFKEAISCVESALTAGDIEESAKYFSSASRSLYQQRFTALLSVLDQVGGDMGQIALVEAEGNRAVYDLITVRDDKIYSYEVVFIRDEEDGIWRIYNF